jgi:hypothetical protein
MPRLLANHSLLAKFNLNQFYHTQIKMPTHFAQWQRGPLNLLKIQLSKQYPENIPDCFNRGGLDAAYWNSRWYVDHFQAFS